MLKMLSTQLTGLFLKIKENEEPALEDGARLLAQAAAGEGKIYLKGFEEMEGVVFEALEGYEPLEYAKKLTQTSDLSQADRVIIFSRFSDHQEAAILAKELADKNIPFVSISTKKNESNDDFSELADVHIDTHVFRPLLPAEDGTRVVFPSLISTLYIYHALKYTIDEILYENE